MGTLRQNNSKMRDREQFLELRGKDWYYHARGINGFWFSRLIIHLLIYRFVHCGCWFSWECRAILHVIERWCYLVLSWMVQDKLVKKMVLVVKFPFSSCVWCRYGVTTYIVSWIVDIVFIQIATIHLSSIRFLMSMELYVVITDTLLMLLYTNY